PPATGGSSASQSAPAQAVPPPAGTEVKPPEPADPATAPVALPPLSRPEGSQDGAPTPTPTPTPTDPPAQAPVPSPAGAQAPEGPAAPRDAEVRSATVDPTAVRSDLPPRSVFEAGRIAAWVGDEVITLQELKVAVTQRRKSMPPGRLSSEDSYYLAK